MLACGTLRYTKLHIRGRTFGLKQLSPPAPHLPQMRREILLFGVFQTELKFSPDPTRIAGTPPNSELKVRKKAGHHPGSVVETSPLCHGPTRRLDSVFTQQVDYGDDRNKSNCVQSNVS